MFFYKMATEVAIKNTVVRSNSNKKSVTLSKEKQKIKNREFYCLTAPWKLSHDTWFMKFGSKLKAEYCSQKIGGMSNNIYR